MTCRSKANYIQAGELSCSPEPGAITEPSGFVTGSVRAPWKLMIIDADERVHHSSRKALKKVTYEGGEINIINGYSVNDARHLIQEHPDTAVMLLGSVGDVEYAGLDVVKFIREQLGNQLVRIVLSVGQVQQTPGKEVVARYDIGNCKGILKSTAAELRATMVSALRNYQDLHKIEQLWLRNSQLEEVVAERTRELNKLIQELQGEIDERTQANISLKKNEARLAMAQRIANLGHWELVLDTGLVCLSQQARLVLGLSDAKDMLAKDDVFANIPDQERQVLEEKLNAVTRDKCSYEMEHCVRHTDGSVAIIRHCGEPLFNESGELVSIIGTVQDITAQYRTNEKMRKLSDAMQQTADAVMMTDCQGIIEYVNPAFEEMTGYAQKEVKGRNASILKSGKQNKAYYQRLWKILRNGGVFSDVIVNRRKDGSHYYEEKTIAPLKDGRGNITHYIATGRDISDRMEAQQRLFHLAHHDALTGLPNRALLQDRLTQVLTRTQQHNRFIALLFLDMDRFKVINDTLGHDVGDTLLQSMAERLADCVREGDTVARLGGDEFAIILNDVAHKGDVTPIADKILSSLAQPFKIGKHELSITTSIGITLSPEHGTDSKTLLKKADAAMYLAKAAGKNNAQFYTNAQDSKAVEKFAFETALRRALTCEEFYLQYQPQIDLRTGKIRGVEALLRWRHKYFSNVSPMYFIALLEESGLIVSVGEWVLERACRQVKQWRDQGLDDLRVAVNISSRQFPLKNLIERVDEILRKTGAAASGLELEFTESLLIENIEETAKYLHQLHDMGVSISIDDFGTGYSSMGYLKKLPIDVLKIDRSFVKNINNNRDDEAIATGVIRLAHSLGLKVVAEGVEHVDQLKLLNNRGCDLIQGYLFSRPVLPEKLSSWLLQEGGVWPGAETDLTI